MGVPLFVVNPVSGGGKTFRHRWPEVEGILHRRGTEYDMVMTEYPGHAIRLAEEAVREGRELIVTVGGDGTLNEVGNGILREAAGGEVPCLGVIPGGRGSDFHRALGIAHDSEGSLEAVLEGKPRPIDAGLIHYVLDGKEEERYFFNICGTGFDAEVTARANRMPGFLGGILPYFLAALVSPFMLEPKKVTLTVDGNERDLGEIAGIVVANGMYYGSGMKVSPHSLMDDGLFNLIIMKKKAPRKLLLRPHWIYQGRHVDMPDIEELTARELAIESRERMLLQPDGEVFGEAPFRFTNKPGALKVMSA